MYMMSLEILHQIGDIWRQRVVYNNLGNIRYKLLDFEKSKSFHEKSLQIETKLNNKKGVANQIAKLAIINFELEDDLSAKDLSLEAISIYKKLNRKKDLLICLHRAFNLLKLDEISLYYNFANEIQISEPDNQDKYMLLDIKLIYSCYTDNDASSKIDKLTAEIESLVESPEDENVLDLPVEAYFVASTYLSNKNFTSEANKLANQALFWIGSRKARRVKDFDRIVQATNSLL